MAHDGATGERHARSILDPLPLGTLLVVASLVSLHTAAAPAGEDDPALVTGYQERSRIDVVEAWPFVVRPEKEKYREHCKLLGPADVGITENGRPVRVVSVVQAPPVSTHALVIDASSSMMSPYTVRTRRRGRQTRLAASTYVRFMLDDAVARRSEAPADVAPVEELIVATFDDDLWLRAGPIPVVDAATVEQVALQIDRITGGYQTTLNDSIYRLLDYLEGRERRASIVLLSDGADQGSDRGYPAVDQLALRANNVTVFPVGIALPPGPHEQFLKRIAEATGGKYYWIRGRSSDLLAAPLRKKFGEIRERLRGQLYISYFALPPGEMEGDADPSRFAGFGAREVRIRSLDARCFVPEDGYRRQRTLAPPGDGEVDTLLTIDPAAHTALDHGALRLTVTEPSRDRGPLIRWNAETLPRRLATRYATLRVAAFDGPRGPAAAAGATPAEILLDWLLDGTIPERPPSGVRALLDSEIGGTTFLELRGAIARAIFDRYEEYRAWATETVEARFRARLESQFPEPASAAERQRREELLDAAVRFRLETISPRDYRDLLADWRGDVHARVLSLAIERDLVNALLGNDPAARRRVDTAQLRWTRLHDGFYFADRFRIVAPLELTCDPRSGSCGFFRIVLPRPADLPEDLTRPTGKTLLPADFEQYLQYASAKVSRHPFALMTVRWLLGLPTHPEGGDAGSDPAPIALPGDWTVAALSYHPEPFPFDARRTEGDQEPQLPATCRRRVSFDLERPGAANTERTTLEIVVDGHVARRETAMPDACEEAGGAPFLEPLCFGTREGPPPTAWIERLQDKGLDPCSTASAGKDGGSS